MNRAVCTLAALGLAWVLGAGEAAACYCGAGRLASCHVGCSAKCTTCCCQKCVVMKTCCETVYDEQEQIFYNTVYEEVPEKKVIDVVKYVEDTEYRCVPCTLWQPATTGCTPLACAPMAAACGPAATCCEKMVPVNICRKVPITVYRPQCVQETIEKPRIVVKRVPYTVTICIPRLVYKQVPVEVCCPVPACCQPCGAAGCGK